jgi:tetratricopeptide repeat protein 30
MLFLFVLSFFLLLSVFHSFFLFLVSTAWFYAKRCFLALAETLAKHMMVFKDQFYQEIMTFLDKAEMHGKEVCTLISTDVNKLVAPRVHNVAYEARVLKSLFLKLRD